MIKFFSDSSNQRKLAVAIAALVAFFSDRVPLLKEVSEARIEAFLAILGVWLAQSGAKAMIEAHAEGKVAVVEAQKESPADALAAAPKP